MDIKEQQMGSEEQKIVLRTLAEYCARPQAKFLEVGSWCGDSTVILGNVAKQHGGILYCVDWWKGNTDTYLMEIAAREDVFLYFWNKICREGLEDVVIPVRGKSEVVSEVLKENTFDLIFIDADHRYDNALKDIKCYMPLVNNNKGILCGHDCEGFISDYDLSFLEAGKNIDDYESVHCGVVLAVSSMFKDYSINHSIWSVRATGKKNPWEATNLTFEGIKDQKRAAPPPIASTKNYILFRYGSSIYAIPKSLGSFDVREEQIRDNPKVVADTSLTGLEKKIGEKTSFEALPVMVDSYRDYNIIQYKGRIYAFCHALGDMDITCIDNETLQKFQKDNTCIITDSVSRAKIIISELCYNKINVELEKRDKKINVLQAELEKRTEE